MPGGSCERDARVARVGLVSPNVAVPTVRAGALRGVESTLGTGRTSRPLPITSAGVREQGATPKLERCNPPPKPRERAEAASREAGPRDGHENGAQRLQRVLPPEGKGQGPGRAAPTAAPGPPALGAGALPRSWPGPGSPPFVGGALTRLAETPHPQRPLPRAPPRWPCSEPLRRGLRDGLRAPGPGPGVDPSGRLSAAGWVWHPTCRGFVGHLN